MLKPPRRLSENRYFSRFDIGEHTFGCPNVLEWGDAGAELSIGKYCSIAADVKILVGGEHRYDWLSTYSFPDFFDGLNVARDNHRGSKGTVKIGNDVWIGYGATILSGVEIGNGAVIGAQAVVAKNIPDYAVAVGNPARIIRQRFDAETVAHLNKLAWWNWSNEKVRKNAGALMSNNLDDLMNGSSQ